MANLPKYYYYLFLINKNQWYSAFHALKRIELELNCFDAMKYLPETLLIRNGEEFISSESSSAPLNDEKF